MKKGTLWIVLGLVLLLTALVLTGINLYQDYAAGQYSENVADKLYALTPSAAQSQAEPDLYPKPYGDLQGSQALAQHRAVEMPTVIIDGDRYVGTLSLPELGLTLPVMQEWNDDKLKKAPCLYFGSVYTGDAVICGHNYRSHFAALINPPPDLTAVFTDVDGNRFTYTLCAVELLQVQDRQEMVEKKQPWELTLFTCTAGRERRSTLRFALQQAVYAAEPQP